MDLGWAVQAPVMMQKNMSKLAVIFFIVMFDRTKQDLCQLSFTCKHYYNFTFNRFIVEMITHFSKAASFVFLE